MIQEMLESWPYFNDSLWKKYLEPFGKERFEKSLSLCKQRFPNYIEEIEGMSVGSEVPFEKVCAWFIIHVFWLRPTSWFWFHCFVRIVQLFLLNIDSIINDDVDTQGRGETGCTSIICNKAEVGLTAFVKHLNEAIVGIWTNSSTFASRSS